MFIATSTPPAKFTRTLTSIPTSIDHTCRMYLDGRDVKRYFIDWSGAYLKYGSNLAAPRSATLFEGERILVRQIPSPLPLAINGAVVSGEELNDINSMIVKSQSSYSNKYILGIINSRLLSFWFDLTFDKFQRAIFPQFKVNELAQFPIRSINFSDPPDNARHDKMAALVDRMLEAPSRAKVLNSLSGSIWPSESAMATSSFESLRSVAWLSVFVRQQ